MKKFLIGLLLLAMGFFPGILFGGNLEIAKVGEWGTGRYRHVYIQGPYAYCAADKAGLDIIDISSPYHPRKVGNMDTPGSAIDVHVKGNYAYVADYHEDKGGLLVIDISRPCCPIQVGTYKCKYLESVYVRGKYAYLIDGRLKIVNISTPSSPILAADYDYDSPRYGGHFFSVDIHVKGNFAYVVADEGNCDDDFSTLHIINISDREAPRIVGECITRHHEYASAVYVQGEYAYLASVEGGLTIVDISKPSAPTEVGYRNSGSYNDVKVSGNYAYCASKRGGLHVIDISDPTSPTLVGKGNNSLGTGVYLSGNYAYVSLDFNGLQVFDISKPDSPKRMGYYDQACIRSGLHYRGNYVYLPRFYGLRVIDVSNPTSPMLTGNVDFTADYDYVPYYYSPFYVRTAWPKEVFFSNDYVYMPDGHERLYIVNVTNPTSPELVGTFEDLWEPTDVYVNGIYAYVASSTRLQIIDVSNPSSPTLVATYKENITNYYSYQFESVYVSGNYAYLACREKCLQVLDIVDPFSPVKVGSLDYSHGYTYNGIIIYVKGKYAYIADKEKGLIIIDVSDPASPQQVGYYDTPGDTHDIRVRGHYAYIADGRKGVQVIDISDPTSPKRAANYKTPGIGCYALHVKGDNIFMVDGEKGKLVALKSFDANTTPCINTDQTGLCFTAITGIQGEPKNYSLLINNSGGGTLNWFLSFQQDWLSCSPTFGTNSGVVSVSVDTANLAAGSYFDTIQVIDPAAVNSPQAISVILNVSDRQTFPPFGIFTTPADNSLVSGGIPFTGWVLDDVGVASVQLFREEKGSLVYIGDAVLIEGARPDIEEAYPNYPNNSKAGWGYMLLTHFLPNGGNGTFRIHAMAADVEGNQVTLGTKTITCDNINTVKPFGTMDKPGQGGTASGNNYINWGWALTPQPNTIPTDGSTITVWVDGVSLGHPVYNLYRQDIAALFPNYNNSNGAGGYFNLDTTPYENGVHTIQWTVTDDAGNTDGIGSRYFIIQNTGNDSGVKSRGQGGLPPCFPPGSSPHDPTYLKKGYNPEIEPQILYPGEDGVVNIRIRELERIEIRLSEGTRGLAPLSNGNKLTNSYRTGYQVIGGQLRSLPVGSFLDTERGVFYWQPGTGFLGKYRFVFITGDQYENKTKKMVEITIGPRFPGFNEKK
ncbi:MAG: hypothetical protein PVH61_02090 [Candidatus Aminicenantes bacterium]|jgi:hypothetical protein